MDDYLEVFEMIQFKKIMIHYYIKDLSKVKSCILLLVVNNFNSIVI